MDFLNKFPGYCGPLRHMEQNESFKFVVNAFKRFTELAKPELIVSIGSSGLLLSPLLSFTTGVPFLHFYKEGSDTHNQGMKLGWLPNASCFRAVFVDDCIYSGSTLKTACSKIADQTNNPLFKFSSVFLLFNYYSYIAREQMSEDGLYGYLDRKEERPCLQVFKEELFHEEFFDG